MANEIGLSGQDYVGVGPLYATAYLLPDGVTQPALAARLYVVEASGSTETYNASHWASYAIPLALSTADGNWYGDWPATGNGTFYVEIYAQIGGSPATSDTDLDAGGVFPWFATAQTFAQTMAADAAAMDDFAEPIVYRRYDSTGKTVIDEWSLSATINRQTPQLIVEDGKVAGWDTTFVIPNVYPLTTIEPARDRIVYSPRYGGPVKEVGVSQVFNSDAAMWTLRAK